MREMSKVEKSSFGMQGLRHRPTMTSLFASCYVIGSWTEIGLSSREGTKDWRVPRRSNWSEKGSELSRAKGP